MVEGRRGGENFSVRLCRASGGLKALRVGGATVLEEGGEYEVAATEREVLVGSMEELMVGAPMRALGLAGDDSSDWSDDPDAEPC